MEIPNNIEFEIAQYINLEFGLNKYVSKINLPLHTANKKRVIGNSLKRKPLKDKLTKAMDCGK